MWMIMIVFGDSRQGANLTGGRPDGRPSGWQPSTWSKQDK